ncbi:MAG: hypothetical protein JWP88_1447 [Flaviaesturariibacter sp.]|nr:hypothetical protein [Flaviaesturariibacter sp.]
MKVLILLVLTNICSHAAKINDTNILFIPKINSNLCNANNIKTCYAINYILKQ